MKLNDLCLAGAALALMTTSACARPVHSQGASASFAGCCSGETFEQRLQLADQYRVGAISDRRFTHAEFWSAVAPSIASPALQTTVIGKSMLEREIRAVTFGEGGTAVLLWSQMHGDESTATMALADIFRFLTEADGDPLRERLRSELKIVFVPMLNPDGAEVFERENAAGIDINRDARRLSTPEGQALKAIRDSLRPRFGFNLHDQSARTRAGRTGPQTAIALSAPPLDEKGSYDDVRSRARLVAAAMAGSLSLEIPGRVAKYDDSFNPRAFGDLTQQWGTSAILVESGALPDDPEKQRLRAINFALLLGALDAIAARAYETADPSVYDSLPYNAGGASDLLIMGGRLALPGRSPMTADIAINFDNPVARTGGRIREVGDLGGAVGVDTLDAAGLFLHLDPAALTAGPDGARLKIGAPAAITVRRGERPDSELVLRVDAAQRP